MVSSPTETNDNDKNDAYSPCISQLQGSKFSLGDYNPLYFRSSREAFFDRIR